MELASIVTTFESVPWAAMAACVGFFAGLTMLLGKWVPGVNRLMGSSLRWMGSLMMADFLERFDNHVNDPEAHARLGRK